jgi:hypothetical protein
VRLTLGPLPAAVYWRRRALLLGGVLATTVAVVYLCSGAHLGRPHDEPDRQGSAESPATESARPDRPSDPSPSPSATTEPVAGSQPQPSEATPVATVAPCSDADIVVTAMPDRPTTRYRQPVRIFLKVKNSSARTCTRDVGDTPQELYLLQGQVKVWSSDACNAGSGSDVRTFAPGVEADFYVVWDATKTTTGCRDRPAAPIGQYQVVARLADKLSEPVPLQVVGAS